MLPAEAEGRIPIRRGHDVVPGMLEHHLKHGPCIGVIFGEQNGLALSSWQASFSASVT
jgi:hypothetical protein